MPSTKVQVMVDTLQNEINDSGWTFGYAEVKYTKDLGEGAVSVNMTDGTELRIVVSETTDPKLRLMCSNCNQLKPGWPDKWRNVAPSPYLLYACGDCVKAEKGRKG